MSDEQRQLTQILKRIIIAASAGSVIEWYDFYISGTAAALIWPHIFFSPKLATSLKLALSVSTFSVVYFSRPIGAALFGNFGDKLGRKSMLIWTLLTMGLGTLGIGLLPSYSQIGFASTILLFVLRWLQGMGLGGEWGGSSTWIVEFTASETLKGRRGFWTGLLQSTAGIGSSLAALTFFLLFTLLPNSFYGFGWRIAYYLGAFVAVVGVVIRYKFDESPMFLTLKNIKALISEPLSMLFKEQWRKILVLSLSTVFIVGVISTDILPYSENLMIAEKIDSKFAVLSVAIGWATGALIAVISATLSDNFGRKRVMLVGALMTLISIYPFFFLIKSGSLLLSIVAEMLLNGSYYITWGVVAAAFSEQFPTKYRYSGVALAYQFSSLIAALPLTLISPLVIAKFGVTGAWAYLGIQGEIFAVISLIAILFIKETMGKKLE